MDAAAPLSEADVGAPGVSVWRVALDPTQDPAEALLDDLTDEEFERLGAFRQVGDRARFAAMRSAVRRVLGDALALAPRDVPILIDPRGKPRLPGDALWFSLAHSGSLGLIALSATSRVGVDVEATRDVDGMEALADLALSPAERRAWSAEPGTIRREQFFRAWTAKEALLKASGAGLLTDPADFSVLDGEALRPRGPTEKLGFDPSGATVRALPAPPGYAAALAVLAPPCLKAAAARRPELEFRHA